jgi:hypothetical protein
MHLKFSKNFRGYTPNPVTKGRGREKEGREGRKGRENPHITMGPEPHLT